MGYEEREWGTRNMEYNTGTANRLENKNRRMGVGGKKRKTVIRSRRMRSRDRRAGIRNGKSLTLIICTWLCSSFMTFDRNPLSLFLVSCETPVPFP